MIAALNRLVDLVEQHLTEGFDVKALARELGTTEYHLRRMFSSLAGMPLSEYVRRRRMTVAAADVVQGEDDLLSIAVRHGYGSTEAFGRAFRAVHGTGPGDVRRDGGPLRTQPQLRFRLTVEGNIPMDTRILDRPAFRLVGHAARVPLIHQGSNPHIQQHISTFPQQEHLRLKALSDTEPGGLLQVCDDLDPDSSEGSELTYLHGVAVSRETPAPDDLDTIEVPAGRWAVFRTAGPILPPCKRPGLRPQPSGSPPTRGACGRAHRSSQYLSVRTTSAPRPASCGYPSNRRDGLRGNPRQQRGYCPVAR